MNGGKFSDSGPMNELSQNRVILKIPGTATQKGGVYYLFGEKVKNLLEEAEPHPFQVFVVGSLIYVRPGTINGLLPGNLVALNGLRGFARSGTSAQFVKIVTQSDTKTMNSAQIQVSTSPPPSQVPQLFAKPATAEFLIAVVFNSQVQQVIRDNLNYYGKEAYRLDKPEGSPPGVFPYDSYFVWG
jgi:hypothetical protein